MLNSSSQLFAFSHYLNRIFPNISVSRVKAIEKMRVLEIDTICTGHGPVLRSEWKKYVNLTERMALNYIEETRSQNNRVLIAFISAYGYTGEMAKKISVGLKNIEGIEVELVDIENISTADLEVKVIRSNGILIGSPTINQNTLLPVYKLFSIINPIRDKGKLAAVFGSYGWSCEAVKLIEDHLRNLKLEIPLEGLSEKFYPADSKAEKFIQFGKAFGEKLLEKKINQENIN